MSIELRPSFLIAMDKIYPSLTAANIGLTSHYYPNEGPGVWNGVEWTFPTLSPAAEGTGSAFEIARANGFLGNEVEWLDTLDKALVGMSVPTNSVTKRQALQALIISEKDEQVIALLDSMTGIEGKLARAEWAESSTVERNRPLVKQMAIGLEMTEKELDDLFILAATL